MPLWITEERNSFGFFSFNLYVQSYFSDSAISGGYRCSCAFLACPFLSFDKIICFWFGSSAEHSVSGNSFEYFAILDLNYILIYYEPINQIIMPTIGAFYIHRPYSIWSDTVLPSSWTNGVETIDASDCNYMVLYIDLTLGATTTSMDLTLNFRESTTATWHQETSSAAVAGTQTESVLTHRFSATGTYRLIVLLMDRWIKAQVRGVGDCAGSSATIRAFVGTA